MIQRVAVVTGDGIGSVVASPCSEEANPLTSHAQGRAYAMAAMLMGSGAAHFLIPSTFDWMVPIELPGSQRLYTYASGAVEILTGALLLVTRTRRLGATAAVVVFVGVLPANLNGVRLWWGKPWPMRLIPILRLPLQAPMITTALEIRRATTRRGGSMPAWGHQRPQARS